MTKRKRISAALLCLLLVFFGVFRWALASSGEGELETLTVGVPADRCPVFYTDQEGALTGIGVDLMRAAAREAGFLAEFRLVEEETLKDALDNPDYDVVMPFGSAITSASGKGTVVSDNLTQTPFTLVTRGSDSLPSLNELRVGMLRSLGGGAETVKSLFPGITIVFYDTMADSVKGLRGGEVDALLHNSYVWSYVLQKPAYSDLAVQPSAMFTMDFRAGTLDTPEGRALMDRLNKGIAAVPETRRQAIVLDHTSRRLYRYDWQDYFYLYSLPVSLGTLLLISLIIITLMKRRSLVLEHEEKLRKLIDHDPLTGALSLIGFRKRVEQLLRSHPERQYLLCYNNIRNFKYINDSLGMAAGDELLCFWARLAQENLNPDEAFGRISADRFAALVRAEGQGRSYHNDLQIFDPVRTYFVDRGQENRLQICTGVYVLTPEDCQHIDVDHMLDFARVAEKRVRSQHKDGYEFYNLEQWESGKRVADVVSHLPAALERGELQVWYQPQIDYESGTITGAEALCRWNHAKLGWLRPSEFIPALEEAGLIYELDCYMWDKVCRDLQRWNAQGIRRCVSVNLSRRDITEERNIPGHFYNLLQTYGLSSEQLRIEITETAYAENPELLIRTTVKLREFGFQVEMDDFGSGYSSLHMLKEVPVDRIKLDLHFLTGTGDPERGRIIIRYVIQMVRELGMNLIAEGVENVTQANFLASRGCGEMQGFYFHKPMSVEEFEALADVSAGT